MELSKAMSQAGESIGVFAVKVRTRAEASVSGTLRQKGFSVLLPTYMARKQYTDRIKKERRPLFPGYVFVHLRPQQLLGLVTTNGVSYVVKHGKALQPLPSHEEVALHSLCGLSDACEPCENFEVGQQVRILSGPLKDQAGILTRVGGRDKIILRINSIFSSVSIDLNDTSVVPITT
jgi:transcription antitermination factor NusG